MNAARQWRISRGELVERYLRGVIAIPEASPEDKESLAER